MFPGDSSMWFFVIGDLLIFGVYFVGYMYFRGQIHEVFLQSQARLNLDIGAINTVMLLTSSLFVALGTEAARAGNRVAALQRFWIALAFGAAFPAAQDVRVDTRNLQRLDAGKEPILHVLLRDDRHAPVPCALGLVIMCFHPAQPGDSEGTQDLVGRTGVSLLAHGRCLYGLSCSPCCT